MKPCLENTQQKKRLVEWLKVEEHLSSKCEAPKFKPQYCQEKKSMYVWAQTHTHRSKYKLHYVT
jgi:hypothetical protein